MRSFQLVGLPSAPFDALFELPDDELARRGARRVVANEAFGFPCRVSLADARPGDELLLLAYQHQPADSPYRASGPIFVRRGAEQKRAAVGEVPEYVSRRLISLRAYDGDDMMIDAEVCAGTEVAAALDRMFADVRARYVHLHNAKRGCFSCLALPR